MITVSDDVKCVCIWGNCDDVNPKLLEKYKNLGYKIVRLKNGTGSIRDCLKAVVTSQC